MAKIVVDLTPLLPGGINGGAKPMVVALLQELPRLMAEDDFILWTADYSHDELAFLDRVNLKRICIRFSDSNEAGHGSNGMNRLIQKGWGLAKAWLPQRIQNRLRAFYYRHRVAPLTAVSAYEIQNADLLFCPFGAPNLYDPSVPILSVVYDLQFLDHPDFFTEQERFYRQLHFEQVCKLTDHIAAISEFTRQSVLKNSNVPPERITTVHIGLLHDYSTGSSPEEAQRVLDRLGLSPGRYLFFPANFWAHKNHKTLLNGFQLFRQRHQGSDLKLVFTGALDERRTLLSATVEQMGLNQHVVAPGFLPDHEIGILYRGAKGLIFPSLYEGFGIPLLEAMQAGIPVACSNVTSLPEIGGDAVLYFNPENTHEISFAIESLEFDDDLRDDLIQKGYERLQSFGDSRAMAQNYANLIRRLLGVKKKPHTYGLHGLTEDQWFQEKAYLAFPMSDEKRILEFSLHIPEWMPGGSEITFSESASRVASFFCKPGDTLRETLELPSSSNVLEIHFSSAHSPASLGITSDPRALSALCERLLIKTSDGMLIYDARPEHSKSKVIA